VLIAAGAIIVVAGLLVYCNTFNVPEIFDDSASISRNTHITHLWPITRAMKAPDQQTTAGRPMLSLSLAINYAISGLKMWSYHAFNLAVHILAGLTLMGIVRRTLLSDRLKGRFKDHAELLAGICALLWVVHPLQTEAVTYTIQRAESMMGLFYLLTIYCAIRSFDSPRRALWYAAATAACAAGMATKEVMATAPLMVLIYDRTFVAKSFKEVARRKGLYMLLAATWAIIIALVATAPRSKSAGFGIAVTPFEYARAQCQIIPHYIRLAFWPDRLVLDYYWPLPESLGEVAPYAAVLLALLAATVVAIRLRPEIGFLGAWFFVILGPSSSFMPIKDLAFEHRMYLSLAAIVCGVVLGAYALAGRFAPARRRVLLPVLLALAAAIAGLLGWRSFDRNLDYASRFTIWKDTVEKAPHNPRAHNNVGYAYREMALEDPKAKNNRRLQQEYFDKAMYHYNKALELDPGYVQAYNNRGAAHGFMGEHDKALADFNASIRLNPKAPMPYCNRGFVYLYRAQAAVANKRFELAARDFAEAKKNFDRAIELDPKYARAYVARGRALTGLGLYDQALKDYDRAKYLQPHLEEIEQARQETLQLKAMRRGSG